MRPMTKIGALLSLTPLVAACATEASFSALPPPGLERRLCPPAESLPASWSLRLDDALTRAEERLEPEDAAALGEAVGLLARARADARACRAALRSAP